MQHMPSICQIKKEANNLGYKTYFTGIPCRNGHISERISKTGKCVECRSAHYKRYYAKPESKIYHNEKHKRYRRENPIKCRQKDNIYRIKTKKLGLCLSCHSSPSELKEDGTRYNNCSACREKVKIRSINYRKEIKIETFNKYGGVICECCGENEIDMLTLDHINDNGSKHRKDLADKNILKRACGNEFYRYLKSLGYPSGYRVMCWNCNISRAFNKGICPHIINRKQQNA